MKIYILNEKDGYDGAEIIGVYATEELALTELHRLAKRNHENSLSSAIRMKRDTTYITYSRAADNYWIEDHEVIGS